VLVRLRDLAADEPASMDHDRVHYQDQGDVSACSIDDLGDPPVEVLLASLGRLHHGTSIGGAVLVAVPENDGKRGVVIRVTILRIASWEPAITHASLSHNAL
jgi:GTPase